MSTIKLENIQHPDSSTPAISLDSSGGMSGSFPYPNRNLIYNGAMQVHQRGTSTASITSGGYYTADRWYANLGNLGAWTQSIEVDGPENSSFTKSLKMLCTTSDASPAAGDLLIIQQNLEGQDLQRIAKGTASVKKLTLSFWVKSNVTGTYIATLYDSDNSRSISSSYTISSSGVWEQKSITFDGDTSGLLDNDNGYSLGAWFWLGAGSNFTSGTLRNSWNSTSILADYAVGQTNVAASVNNYWQITGVQLETGPVATEFEHEPYGVTLAKCQRYYYRHAGGSSGTVIASGAMWSSTEVNATVNFPVTMRGAPSLNAASGTDYYQFARNGGYDNFNSFLIAWSQPNAALLYQNSGLSGTAGHGGNLRINNASAYIDFNAEL